MGNGDNMIHAGHRQRMRDKYSHNSQSVFQSYELLEMLLYHVIPFKDTNPIAKKLLIRFGSLEGIFSAKREELMQVSGVGPACVELLKSMELLTDVANLEPKRSVVLDDYNKAGEFIVDYYRDKDDSVNIIMLSLDNSMMLIDVNEISHLDLGSGGVRSRPFIDTGMANGASFVMISHRHKFGPIIHTGGDLATIKLLERDLGDVGIKVIEQYIVVGEQYSSFNQIAAGRLASSDTAAQRFLESKKRSLENEK